MHVILISIVQNWYYDLLRTNWCQIDYDKLDHITVQVFDLDKTCSTNRFQPSEHNTLTRAISTTCQFLSYALKVAKQANVYSFIMLENFGINSRFLAFTPCDKFNFHVQLYCKARITVCHLQLFGLFLNVTKNYFYL